MPRRLALLVLALSFLAARVAPADTSTYRLLLHAWPGAQAKKVSEIGRGVGVVFSPDLSVPNNCNFYQTLGFLVTMTLLLFALILGAERRNPIYAAIYSLGVVLLTYLLFTMVLRTPLDRGIFGL